MPVIKVPAVLSDTGSAERVMVDGDTVLEAFDSYSSDHGSEIDDKVLVDGSIKEYINVYVNGKDVRNLQGIDTPTEEDDEIRIIPAASGGM